MSHPRRTSAEMYPLIETFLASGQSQKTFCSDYHLSEAVLNYWLSKYRREQDNSSEAFVAVNPEPVDAVFMELVYPSGVHLRFFAPMPVAYLSELLQCDR